MSEPEPETKVEEETSSAPAVSSARARAEARRRRILQQSKNRMQAVSGGPTPVPVTDSDPAPDAEGSNEPEEESVNATEVENVEAKEGTEKASDETEAPVSSSPAKASTGSSRYAQMRRRRYKKAAEALKEETPDTENKEGTEEETAETPASKSEEKPEGSATEPTSTGDIPASAEEAKPSAPAVTGEKKKYMGVVKMRRKKLAEEKARKEAELDSKIESDLKKSAASAAMKISGPKPVALKPILFQLFTVLALFLVGFDVGMQNHALVQQDVPNVHTDLFFVDNGIALFGAKKGASASTTSQDTIMEVDDTVEIPGISVEDDEFDDVNDKKPAGATASSEPNIDPLFGVDFDKLTAGPGFFMMAARFAVSIHRSFTYFFYTLPLSILHLILAIPKRLFTHPPVWFLFAVFIRYIGKHVLGGEIPALDEILEAEAKADEPPEEKPDLASSIASTNFLSMGTNFVKNFMKTNFPTLVLLFTIFKDSRTDLFLILCGFFVGLVFPSGLLISTSVSDEL